MNNFYKKIVSLVCAFFLFFSVHAQNSHVALEDMLGAIKANNVQNMDKYMDYFVTITINNIQSVYSHNQAQVILHDFFEKNDAKDMLLMDSGDRSSSSSFAIGSYDTPSGNKYTVYVLMKMKNNRYVVQEIRMNKE